MNISITWILWPASFLLFCFGENIGVIIFIFARKFEFNRPEIFLACQGYPFVCTNTISIVFVFLILVIFFMSCYDLLYWKSLIYCILLYNLFYNSGARLTCVHLDNFIEILNWITMFIKFRQIRRNYFVIYPTHA